MTTRPDCGAFILRGWQAKTVLTSHLASMRALEDWFKDGELIDSMLHARVVP